TSGSTPPTPGWSSPSVRSRGSPRRRGASADGCASAASTWRSGSGSGPEPPRGADRTTREGGGTLGRGLRTGKNGAMADSVPVLIVDDQAPFRRAARMVVTATPGFDVVG